MKIVLLTIALDQAAKVTALKFLDTTCNRGVAFGISFGQLNLIISALILGLIFYLLKKEEKVANKYALALILGGGVSNFADRIIRGCVIDFVPWPFLVQLPAFNLADAAIAVGVGLVIFSHVKVGRYSF